LRIIELRQILNHLALSTTGNKGPQISRIITAVEVNVIGMISLCQRDISESSGDAHKLERVKSTFELLNNLSTARNGRKITSSIPDDVKPSPQLSLGSEVKPAFKPDTVVVPPTIKSTTSTWSRTSNATNTATITPAYHHSDTVCLPTYFRDKYEQR
jgi:hypothetical protein